MAFGKNTSDEDTDLERDAEGDGVDNKSEAEIEGLEAGSEDTEGQRDADDTGDGAPEKLPVGVKKRFAKMSAQKRKLEGERDVLAARLSAYEAKEREKEDRRKAAEARTPEGQESAQRKTQIRNALDETYGQGYSDWVERDRAEREQERQLQKEQYALNGISFLKSELQDHGLAVDDKTIVRWEHAVGSELAEDPELLAAFKRPATQGDAIAEAFNRVRDGLANPAIKQQGGKPLARIERNRAALLGSGRTQGGADEGSPYPDDYTAKPPKGATGQQLEEFWSNHREQMWKKLNAPA